VGKLLTKIAMMLFVMLGISNYGFYLMTGKNPFSGFKLPDFSPPSLSDNPLGNGKETAYKWTDEHGVTHYSNEAPPVELAAEVLEVDPNVNVIQSVEVPKKDTRQEPSAITPVEGPLYKPENIKKLIDDAKNVEKVLQDRHEKQEEIINSM